MDFNNLKLSNQLCFPLYACSKEIIKLYREPLKKIGLTYTQYIALMVLWEHGDITVSELGKHLYLDSGTITPLVKKLEKDGLLSRKRSTEDERIVIVALTEKGDHLKIDAQIIPETIKDSINLTGDEFRDLYRILYKVLDQV